MALMLLFKLDRDCYGLETDCIQQIIEAPVLFQVPQAKQFLQGAINLRGKILASIDLPELLGFSPNRKDHRQLVLTPKYLSLVLSVTEILRIVKIAGEDIQAPPSDPETKAIRGVFNHNGSINHLLDVDEVLRKLEHLFAS